MFGVHSLNLIEYKVVLGLYSALLLYGLIGVTWLGLILGESKVVRSGYRQAVKTNKLVCNPEVYRILVGLSLLYTATVLGDIGFVVKGLLSASFDLQQQRVAHWDGFGGGMSGGSAIKSVGRSASMMLASLTYYSVLSKRKFWLLGSLIGWFNLLALSISDASRATIMFSMIMAGFVYVHCLRVDVRVKEKKINKKLVGIAAIAVYFVLVVFPAMRNPDIVDAYDKYLQFRDDSHLSEWVVSASRHQGAEHLSSLAFGSGYLSIPVVKFNQHVEGGVASWYYGGVYNVPIIGKVIALFTGNNPWYEVRERIEQMILSQGHLATNPWATGFRDVFIDFGIVLGFVVCFVVSYTFSWASAHFSRSTRIESILLVAVISVGIFVFPFTSSLRITAIFNTLVLALLVNKFKNRKIVFNR
jgi:hypothetical protein